MLDCAAFWDHPRMGGEKSIVAPRSDPGTGSPPHGRGKDSPTPPAAFCHGITPAWAGKRWTVAGTVAARWDHPRMGGEKTAVAPFAITPTGSPPHGRGKGPAGAPVGRLVGITPAWAGKSFKQLYAKCFCQDHPRMGGEKTLRSSPFTSCAGSPPHGRGKAILRSRELEALGITPAWAGKSARLQAAGRGR